VSERPASADPPRGGADFPLYGRKIRTTAAQSGDLDLTEARLSGVTGGCD